MAEETEDMSKKMTESVKCSENGFVWRVKEKAAVWFWFVCSQPPKVGDAN